MDYFIRVVNVAVDQSKDESKQEKFVSQLKAITHLW